MLSNYEELKSIHNHQKSFYGKARIFRKKDRIYLISYNTIVGFVDNEHYILHRLWGDYSKTTLIHVNEFVKQFIRSDLFISASDWRKMEVE